MTGRRMFRNFCVLLCAALLAVGAWKTWCPADFPVRAASTLQTLVTDQPQATQAPQVSRAAAELDAEALDQFCAGQPGSFSVYIEDLETGRVYTYGAEYEYYPASLLKAAYALWLCEWAEDGLLDLSGELVNPYVGQLAGSSLSDYDNAATIPLWTVLHAMIADSDNLAMRMLAGVWPALEETGFPAFLGEMGFHLAGSCQITMEDGIAGVMSVSDAGAMMEALYRYFETGTATALQLQQCFFDAGHDALYIPAGVNAAKKYGSWDYAFHDLAIVYAEHPYILCCMTDQGNAEVDFPAAPVAAMQALGQMVCEQLNPA